MSDDKKDNILDFVKLKKLKKSKEDKVGRGLKNQLYQLEFEMAIAMHGKKNTYLLPVSTIEAIIRGELCFTNLDKDWEDVLQAILKDWLKDKQLEFKQVTE